MEITETIEFDVFVGFAPVIRSFNTRIDEFNQQLSGPGFMPVTRRDTSSYTNNLQRPWGAEQTWPRKDDYGVYALLYCGVDDASVMHAYVGKASQKQIGHRLYNHLTPYRYANSYVRHCGTMELKAIVATAAPADRPYMAAALEEFLLARGLPDTTLLNTVGKRIKA